MVGVSLWAERRLSGGYRGGGLLILRSSSRRAAIEGLSSSSALRLSYGCRPPRAMVSMSNTGIGEPFAAGIVMPASRNWMSTKLGRAPRSYSPKETVMRRVSLWRALVVKFTYGISIGTFAPAGKSEKHITTEQP